ncbi:YibE/F-like protein [Natranaerovirga pectinivora]|uniref:YibE/F-like protein n=1 Tax=Natranaerovirga pectinivora TaxID=682400 RepID=A0A4R3MLX3_9FIRM|nr:YibE/F family protein [Natranaerovirga pectinivora]TCT13871.1 YibE/F-like protein [Natranaerovirga pectinivora]
MNVIPILIIILFVLMLLVGGSRGIRTFFTLFFNFIIFFFMLFFIALSFDPILITIIASIAITYITLFFLNGVNQKTKSSFISVIIVVLITMLITYTMSRNAKIQGFSTEELDSIATLSLYVNLNFSKIILCQILIGLLGGIIDVSISVASAMNEVFRNNPLIEKKDLLKSGLNIGKDILGIMTNTLLFAYMSGFISLMIYFNILKYSFGNMVNSKIFVSEIFQLLIGGIGIILIIPITALITTETLTKRDALPQKE